MKVNYVLLISLLIVGALFVPAVSAAVVDEDLIEYMDSGGIFSVAGGGSSGSASTSTIQFSGIESHTDLAYIIIDYPSGDLGIFSEGRHEGTYKLNGVTYPAVIYMEYNRNVVGTITNYRLIFFPQVWDTSGLGGHQSLTIHNENGVAWRLAGASVSKWISPSEQPFWIGSANGNLPSNPYKMTLASSYVWKNRLVVDDYVLSSYSVNLMRLIDDSIFASTISVSKDDTTVYQDSSMTNIETYFLKSQIDKITITSPSTTYTYPLGTTSTPKDPEEPTVMRTGTVTTTDNNGTAISGFEVTAINHYTGEEYTVSTDTDVAVMTLPMDRSINIRNPQTGVYEEAPIGYYRFYVQAPGYKMLHEDGIQISVMPEKYGSYQLCDIRVTSETGYLTGNHQFQIRSRSDNSILQSGTISAKSASTGEWYNTTVSGGIASLILPYDTSNVQSQYAGNYYVYATSPGFEDSDYGTQIVVMPHTVSEIKSILLTPIGGVPTSGNVTLRIQAFSETGTGIPNAEIFVAGVLGEGASVWNTYIASSTGYLTVSVPGNSTYDIVASGTGYYDSARRVTVFDTDPALIEIKLYLSGAPTPPVVPTTQPTGWVTPTTPTQTMPPIQEDNIIGMSVKGLAKGFGIDYDTALLLFGLMIVFGAGGIVMSSVKGGAMEFIAGSIVGTFVAFALGLIPIWIFIIIAVVFGAYVLRVFVQGGQ